MAVKTKVDSKERILDSGLNLLTRVGLDGVTVGTLAAASGMSKSGLFAHFKSKDEMQIRLLDRAGEIARHHVVEPAMKVPAGLPRLRSLVERWFNWTRKAKLDGGCPVAAGLFELDDSEGPVRDHLSKMERVWRGLLLQLVKEAKEAGHLRPDLDADQFVWELCGIYLSHHASARFLRDPKANRRADNAFTALVQRSLPSPKAP